MGARIVETRALAGAPDAHAAIRTGFAVLAPSETTAQLIARADHHLTATRLR